VEDGLGECAHKKSVVVVEDGLGERAKNYFFHKRKNFASR
jgi:hypothetical protein